MVEPIPIELLGTASDRHADFCLWPYEPLAPVAGKLRSEAVLWAATRLDPQGEVEHLDPDHPGGAEDQRPHGALTGQTADPSMRVGPDLLLHLDLEFALEVVWHPLRTDVVEVVVEGVIREESMVVIEPDREIGERSKSWGHILACR